jgi:F0F1-type ATP synthase alpha subunit
MQNGCYDDLELKAVAPAAATLRDFFATRHPALLAEISAKAKLDDTIESKIKTAADEWKVTQPQKAGLPKAKN